MGRHVFQPVHLENSNQKMVLNASNVILNSAKHACLYQSAESATVDLNLVYHRILV